MVLGWLNLDGPCPPHACPGSTNPHSLEFLHPMVVPSYLALLSQMIERSCLSAANLATVIWEVDQQQSPRSFVAASETKNFKKKENLLISYTCGGGARTCHSIVGVNRLSVPDMSLYCGGELRILGWLLPLLAMLYIEMTIHLPSGVTVMANQKMSGSLITYDLMIPSALAKRASEVMASTGLSRLNLKAMVFLADLVRRSTINKENKDWIGKRRIKPRFVQVSSRLARRSFDRNADYSAMVRALVAGGIIEVGRNYVPGSHCRSYRPAVDLVNSQREIQAASGRQAASLVVPLPVRHQCSHCDARCRYSSPRSQPFVGCLSPVTHRQCWIARHSQPTRRAERSMSGTNTP